MIPVDIYGEFVRAWSAEVSASRARQGLPPLNGYDGNDGQIAIGKERIYDEMEAPRIVLVPVGIGNYRSEQRMPGPSTQPAGPTHTMTDNQPKVQWTAALRFTVHFWGDEWPGETPKPIWWDFNTSFELHREFFGVAIARTCGTALERGVSLEGGDFVQETDQARRGRWLDCAFSIRVPICDEPYVMLQYGAHPKVEIDLQTNPVTGEIVIPS